MLSYRLARGKYIQDLTGEGARKYGGRWNHKGTPVLYTSEHCSLALLELLVHTSKHLLPNDIYLLKLSIPDDTALLNIKLDDLPANWQQYPAPETLADLGTKWCIDNKTVALKVPSVIIPEEWNILLNPLHPAFQNCTIETVSAFNIDFRIPDL